MGLVWMALAIVGCSGDPLDTQVEPILPELPAGIHRMSGDDFSLPTADLAPLTEMLAGASVVGVGESIHYSGGFHATRARVMKKLILEDDFRIVALEGSWQRAYATRDYVDTCDPESLPRGMAGMTFGVWQSPENAEFLQWLCTFNQDHPEDPVTFIGVDVQEPWYDMQLLHGRYSEEPVFQELSTCVGFGQEPGDDPAEDPVVARLMQGETGLPEEDTAQCLVGIQAMRTWLIDQPDPYVPRVALRALEAGQQQFGLGRSQYTPSFEARDAGMADLLMMQRAEISPDARTVYWAHNGHIMDNGDQVIDPFNRNPPVTAGTYLAGELGDEYAAIGFGAHTVSWDWPGLGADTVESDAGSLESRLYELNEPFLLVDVEQLTANEELLSPGESIDFGNPHPNTMAPRDHFRAIVYADESEAMVSFWGE